jgi:hypothetical protein
MRGSLGRHISRAKGHSFAYFRSNISAESFTNDFEPSESFADFADIERLENDDIQAINIPESLEGDNEIEERKVGRLERYPNAGINYLN